MSYENLRDKRYINLVRCSSAEQIETSITDQLKLLNAFAAEHGMVYVDDVILDGVTGSVPGARDDIEKLIQRKLQRDDFDVLLVQDLSRLTRGGAEHGVKLEFDISAAGIELVFAAEQMPEGDHGGIVRSVTYYAARQHAKGIALAATRGSMSSLLDGRKAYSSRIPFGIDRLYLAPDGTELHIIRNLADGTQQKLHPRTRELSQTFGRNVRKKRSRHYLKQSDERIVLIPGADDRVRIVNQIFRWKLIDGWGTFRIAEALNNQGARSYDGKLWGISSLQQILDSPIYIGTGIANRVSRSVYFRRSASAPAPVKVEKRELASRKHPRKRLRPRIDWVVMDEPRLTEYLDADIRELARTMLTKRLDAMAMGLKTKPNKDRHVESPFILKGILHSKQGSHPMTGRNSTHWDGKSARWYSVSRAYTSPTSDQTLRTYVHAEPLEHAVLELLRDALLQAPDLRPQIRREVERQLKAALVDGDDIAKLNAEAEALRRKFEFIIDDLGTLGREVAKQKVEQIEAQLRAVNDRLVRAGAAVSGATIDVNKAADGLVGRLAQTAKTMRDLPPSSLRRLLQVLIARMEVDMVTREVEIELALPLWAALDAGAYENAIRLDTNSACRVGIEATDPALPLGAYACAIVRGPICYRCRRRSAA